MCDCMFNTHMFYSLDELDAAIKPTGFKVVRKPNYKAKLRRVKSFKILGLLFNSKISTHFDACLSLSLIEHIINTTNYQATNILGKTISIT